MPDYFNVQVPIEEAAATCCGEVLERWQELKADAFAPSWTSLDLSALPAVAIPYASVVDVINGGAAFRYRFWGTGLSDILGIERTGATLSDTGAWPRTNGGTECRAVVEGREPLAFCRRVTASPQDPPFTELRALGLRLPLSSDGSAVDHILTVFDLSTYRNDWKLLFERFPHVDQAPT